MKLKIKQINPDSTLESLVALLDSLVLVKAAQYEFESNTDVNVEFFQDASNYKSFFQQFSQQANPLWQEEWDFSKVPYRSHSEEISGLIAILRSGGAYSDGHSFSEAHQIEEEFRFRFKGDSSELVILSMVQYEYSDHETTSFTLDLKELSSLSQISKWFLQIAWDNLIFIINPDSRMMYVVAYTDED
ncbi:MAG: hypothetical protein ACW98Y_14995 [Candidatus Thorarchaeota archaeon]